MTTFFDTVIIGAGAAGMMCAARIGQKGQSVALLDHAAKIGEKIRISGGGRCNFTNRHLNGHDGAPYFVSQQPRFVRHALSRYTSTDFTALLEHHGIPYHEKHKGQLFCDRSAQDIINMLQNECAKGHVQWHTECVIESVEPIQTASVARFELHTNQGRFSCRNLVVATGSGKAAMQFDEDLLFRHKGLSGPAILQISSYWQPGQAIIINLAPDAELPHALCSGKHGQKIQLNTALAQLCPHLPSRLLDFWLAQPEWAPLAAHKWADTPDAALAALGQSLNQWALLPSGSDGHKKAEATRGGVDVREIDAKTMQSKLAPGLYFIGEVMDITGWLGGYNFQWAWASAVCAAAAITDGATQQAV